MLYWFLLVIVITVWLKVSITKSAPILPYATTDGFSLLHQYVYNKGVIHCHTAYSDGCSSFEEIISDSNQLGLDFLLTSDHNTLQPKIDGWEGWHGRTLVLVGEELSTDAGHLLVFNVDQKVPVTESQAAIDFANAHGGISFIAHPENLKHSWKNWNAKNYTGLEIVNFDSICRSKASHVMGFLGLLFFLFSPRHLENVILNNTPYRELKRWDKLTVSRKMVGIGSTDAHGCLKVGKKKYHIPSYLSSFQTVYTHILLKDKFTQDLEIDKKMFYQALTRGNAYFSLDLPISADGFQFFAHSSTDFAIMGDDITLLPNDSITLSVILPPGQDGIIQIILNGVMIASGVGSQLIVQVNKKGTYRAMAFQYQMKLPFDLFYRKKFWIGSNPIYVQTNSVPEHN